MDESGDANPDPALIFPGPIALVAGPGSGKTSRLASRIKHLVEKLGADPTTIAVITFTREAARNMKERLTPPAKAGMPDVTLPLEKHPTTICTMHSLGWRIVGENAARLAMPPGCGLLPVHMRQILFDDAARLCGEKGAFGTYCAVRKAKVGAPVDDRERKVFDAYRRILNACNVIDYDDQIILACQLLREHEDLRQTWQSRAKHLLVDEYQDINPPQLEFIQLLSGTDASGLFVVGDDDQSIYGFRGAEPSYIRNFLNQFKNGKMKAIADCFRCQPHVIGAAQGFIEAFNPDRLKKPQPKCSRPEGARVCVHSVPSDTREAEIMAAMIIDAAHDGDVLVLVPKADYADQLKVMLRRHHIAFEAPAVRTSEASQIFAALRDWLSDNRDNLAFRELLNAICDSGVLGIPGPRARKPDKVIEREAALGAVSQLWASVFAGASLPESLSSAAGKENIYTRLDGMTKELATATQGTLSEFGVRTFETLRPWRTSQRMLDELAAPRGEVFGAADGDASSVRIMTMRNSKGLEAESVFVIGLEEGAFPAENLGSPRFEEDARLFFVSMTRAKKELHLFHARTRSGGNTYQPESFNLKPSPFVDGLPKDHVQSKYHQSAAQRASKKARNSQ